MSDSATVAGIVAVCFSVGCMTGSLICSRTFSWLGHKSLPVSLLVTAAGIAGCGAVRSVVLLFVLIFIAGVGFSLAQACGMMILGLAASYRRIALVSAIMMALFNLGMFLSSNFEDGVGAIMGDALYMPLFIGTAALIVFSVIYAVSPLLKKRWSRKKTDPGLPCRLT